MQHKVNSLKLSKRPRRHDPRTLKLARYMTAALPAPPARVDYTRGVAEWEMMLNDTLGDCTIADGPGHATQVWTLNAAGAMVTPPDSLILETYEKWCGYNPADPSTDQGGVELDVLNHWRQQGFGGQKLEAFVAIELGTRDTGLGTREDPSAQRPTLTCLTWGQPKKMTWAWLGKYCSEAYALVSKEWLNARGISPSGLDLDALENDLKLVTA